MMTKQQQISKTVSETPYTKTTTSKTEHTKCYCEGAWEICQLSRPPFYNSKFQTEKLKQVTKQPITHKNCPCDSKYSSFKKKHKEEYKDLKDAVILQKFLEIEDFGPCVKCKGTGKQIFTHKSVLSKYLCVNGPLVGQRFTTTDMDEIYQEYYLFNNSSQGFPDTKRKLKAIWVYGDSLKEPKDESK